MKTIIFLLSFILTIAFSACVPIELIDTKEYSIDGVVRNYITNQPLKNITVIAEHNPAGQFIKFCGFNRSSATTNEMGRFSLDFEGGCGYSFELDLKNSEDFDKFAQYQLIINDKPCLREIARSLDGSDLVVELQPYIILDLNYEENKDLELQEVRIPEFDIQTDSLKYGIRQNLYLKKYSGSFDIIAYYGNNVQKVIKTEYDYFKNPTLRINLEK
jgi:hypothetical protein